MSRIAGSRLSGRRCLVLRQPIWHTARPITYPVKLTILCDDRPGILKELTAIISDDGTNIRGVDSKSDDEGGAVVEFIVEAEDVRHLTKLVTNMRRVPGVRDVHRAQKL